MRAQHNKEKGALPLEDFCIKLRLDDFFGNGEKLTLNHLLESSDRDATSQSLARDLRGTDSRRRQRPMVIAVMGGHGGSSYVTLHRHCPYRVSCGVFIVGGRAIPRCCLCGVVFERFRRHRAKHAELQRTPRICGRTLIVGAKKGPTTEGNRGRIARSFGSCMRSAKLIGRTR